jgi:hypothetical protein
VHMRCKALKMIVLGVAGSALSTASAGAILTFGFTDLSGSFDTGSSVMRAVAVDTEDFATSGDVTRLADPGATANFDTGFVTRSANADVDLMMTLSSITAVTADASGSIVITDDDGDTITATLNGMFSTPGAGITFFTGFLSDVVLTGEEFNGPDGGAFATDLPGQAPYEGAVVQLFINSGGGFFDANFDNESIQLDGIIVPTPGSMALMGLAGLVGARRRRA